MTLQSSGPISTGDVSTELGLGSTYSASLSFLNGYMLTPQSSPNLGQFYSLAYFQNNTQGNCNNGNCTNNNCPPTDCTNCNCNCGNIQCRQCLPYGAYSSQCTNCSPVDCNNCQSQPYLQPNCNCSGGYACNCNATVGYNCGAAASASYNCNCACNCSKIVCGKLHEFGLMSSNIWAADQAYGRQLRKTDKDVYRGYIRWARPVTQWMDGKGPDFMLWVNKENRSKVQAEMMIALTHKVGAPWSEHMAYLMGAIKTDNEQGRILMKIGRFFCKSVNLIPKVPTKYKKYKLLTPYSLLSSYTIWFLLEFSYYASLAYLKSIQIFNELTNKEVVKEH